MTAVPGPRPSPGAEILANTPAPNPSHPAPRSELSAPADGRRPLLLAFALLCTCWQLVAGTTPSNTNEPLAVRAEKLRATCLEGRRCVAGRVLKVLPDGLLVQSGYPSLLRDSLHGAWHIPGTVVASRATNLVESLDPDSLCVGTVFLTDLPTNRGKKEKIAPYDYVVLHSYPAGQYTYTSVGGIQHTVRRFAGGLETAVNLILKSQPASPSPAAK